MAMFVAFGEFASVEAEVWVDEMFVKLGIAGTEDEAEDKCEDDCAGRDEVDIAADSGIRLLM